MTRVLRTAPEEFDTDEVLLYPDYETLKLQFSRKIQPTPIHDLLMQQIGLYVNENEKFQNKRNAEAARRARIALLNIYHLTRARRQEIMTIKNNPQFKDKDFRA